MHPISIGHVPNEESDHLVHLRRLRLEPDRVWPLVTSLNYYFFCFDVSLEAPIFLAHFFFVHSNWIHSSKIYHLPPQTSIGLLLYDMTLLNRGHGEMVSSRSTQIMALFLQDAQSWSCDNSMGMRWRVAHILSIFFFIFFTPTLLPIHPQSIF